MAFSVFSVGSSAGAEGLGELARRSSGPETTSYVYDVQGALTHVTLPTGIAIEYVTDADGRRIGKRVHGVLVQGWIYTGGLAPIAEADGAGTITTRYVYGTRVNVPELLVRGGRTYRIVTDHLGSVRFVVDASDGTIVQRLDYDAFGRITLDTNPGWQPFGFAGGMYDPQTGLTRFGARDYDPEIGRWTSKDPIGFAGGSTGLYTYVENDPVSRADPLGLVDEPQGPPLTVGNIDPLELFQTIGEVANTIVAVLANAYHDITVGHSDEQFCLGTRDGGEICGEGFTMGMVPSGPGSLVGKAVPGITRSTLRLGQEVHRAYKTGLVNGVTRFKEFRFDLLPELTPR